MSSSEYANSRKPDSTNRGASGGCESIEKYITKFNTLHSINKLRGETFAQPLALMAGNILSGGQMVQGSTVRESQVGGVRVNFDTREKRVVPGRIPLRLMSDVPGVLPEELKIGQVLESGCVVLDSPKHTGSNPERHNQDEVGVALTHYKNGGFITMPSDLEIAVWGNLEDVNSSTMFGKFVLERLALLRRPVKENISDILKRFDD